jgi:aryl-alcohol dehydrogenase-like predicted oxidoreductase
MIPRFSEENFPKVLAVAEALKSIGEKHKATAGQVALAWILGQGDLFLPIPGTQSIKVRYHYCNRMRMLTAVP